MQRRSMYWPSDIMYRTFLKHFSLVMSLCVLLALPFLEYINFIIPSSYSELHHQKTERNEKGHWNTFTVVLSQEGNKSHTIVVTNFTIISHRREYLVAQIYYHWFYLVKREAVVPHSLQDKEFSPIWILRCNWAFEVLIKFFPHSLRL